MSESAPPKTLVLVHGFHLAAPHWEDVIWGDPNNARFGRAAKGIIEAVKFEATCILFGSGVPQDDGSFESERIYAYACSHLDEIAPHTGKETEELKEWLLTRVHFDRASLDTRGELLTASRLIRESGIERLVQVSSQWHIMRCLKEGLLACDAGPELKPMVSNLYATASDTFEGDTSIDNVVILEPPHRPDRPQVAFAETAKKLIPFMTQGKTEIARGLNEELVRVIEEWTEKL